MMIEGQADFLTEEQMERAIDVGMAAIRRLCKGLALFAAKCAPGHTHKYARYWKPLALSSPYLSQVPSLRSPGGQHCGGASERGFALPCERGLSEATAGCRRQDGARGARHRCAWGTAYGGVAAPP
jgi:hypothetical protein